MAMNPVVKVRRKHARQSGARALKHVAESNFRAKQALTFTSLPAMRDNLNKYAAAMCQLAAEVAQRSAHYAFEAHPDLRES